ncbi:MAG: hypothetical protein HDS22_04925 [Bacteroides sp.]|nr:hypothetical protein [Bacteroides sp.]
MIETDDKSVTVKLPMFTRPKELIPSSDFSGNNPFYAYRRKAKVRFSLRKKDAPNPKTDSYDDTYDINFKIKDVEGNEEEVKYVDIVIYQVPRIVNPKAIWRKHDSTESFHVQLLQLDGAGASSFSEFTSEGPWRASILTDPDGLIKLEGNGNTVTNASTGENAYIHGSSGTSVNFTYTPTGTIGANETRCGIILVEYHDYTCNHLIFVRQGYDCGVELGGNKWSCYNAYATGSISDSQPEELTSTNVVVTNSPLSIGSLFKRCNYNYAILESNCENYGWLEKITGNGTLLKTAYVNNATSSKYSTRDANWDNLLGYAWTKYDSNNSRFETSWAENWTAVNKNNAAMTIPTYEDYIKLRDESEYGYGVVYADGAGGVATSIEDAFGFTDYENTGEGSPKGMRACVVYDSKTAAHIIFPIGAVGQGRRARKTFTNSWNATYNGTQLTNMGSPGAGALTYSGFGSLLYTSPATGGTARSNNDRPLTYNIYREPGAIYWFKKPSRREASTSTDDRTASWDINFYTLVFNPYDNSSLGERIYNADEDKWTNITWADSSDALPIRLIYK